MKLRNKRTGEIYNFKITPDYDDAMSGWKIENKDFGVRYYSHLAELDAEWEDVPEEPKEYWYISAYGNLAKTDVMTDLHRGAEEIGNLFSTIEEAEKARDKLKAWHKLIGYWETEILGWEIRDMPTGGNWQTVNVKFNIKARKEPMELLDLLFGGEGE